MKISRKNLEKSRMAEIIHMKDEDFEINTRSKIKVAYLSPFYAKSINKFFIRKVNSKVIFWHKLKNKSFL